jgi:hypothetical protein
MWRMNMKFNWCQAALTHKRSVRQSVHVRCRLLIRHTSGMSHFRSRISSVLLPENNYSLTVQEISYPFNFTNNSLSVLICILSFASYIRGYKQLFLMRIF